MKLMNAIGMSCTCFRPLCFCGHFWSEKGSMSMIRRHQDEIHLSEACISSDGAQNCNKLRSISNQSPSDYFTSCIVLVNLKLLEVLIRAAGGVISSSQRHKNMERSPRPMQV